MQQILLSLGSDFNVAYRHLLPDEEESRGYLVALGVPIEKLPEGGGGDLPTLLYSLDRLFATGGGHGAVRSFLRFPSEDLGGKAPQDVLCDHGGIGRVRDLVQREVEISASAG